MQDPNPLPWGAQDRYQAHFIVRTTDKTNDEHSAKTSLTTKGHFSSKKVIGVKWVGGKLASALNDDTKLTKMIIKQSVKDASIWIDPTENGVRIYGKWKNGHEFGITHELFEIYDKIASYITKS